MKSLRFAAVLLAATALAGIANAKPLYITVPRAYGPAESPVIDVSFEGKEPVELRILKPNDLDAFISSQSNLRRAYEQPETEVNPGRYLARGMNSIHDPGGFLLRALDPEFRRKVSGSLPETGESIGHLQRIGERQKKLVGVPPGMTMVKSHYLNLDLGGDAREFNVPGFESWGGEGRFQDRKVTLDPLASGVYVIQIVQGAVEGQVLLTVSDMTVQAKQTDGKILVRVAGHDQKPRAGADVQVFLPRGKGPAAKTDEKGEATLAVSDPKLLVKVGLAGDVALVDTDFYSTLAVTPDVFLYGDRPIYRPGDKVSFRGILRKPDAALAQLFRPRKKKVQVSLETSGHEGFAASVDADVDEFGSFNGSIKVPEGLATGILRLVAKVDDAEHGSEARVQEYVKPTFYVELESSEENATPGGSIHATVHARRYAGGPSKKTRFEVFLYRTVLDTPAWVDDANMGGKGSAVTYGTASTTEGKLSVPKRLYSSIEDRMSEGGEDAWASAKEFDDKGDAQIEIPVPKLDVGEDRMPFRYTVSVRARDDQETFANATKSFFHADSDVMGTIRADKRVVLAGGKEPTLSVRATTLSGKPYGEADGSVEWVLRSAEESDSSLSTEKIHTGPDGVWRGKVPVAKSGIVVARVTLTDKKGKNWSGDSQVVVAGAKGEALTHVPLLAVDAVEGTLAPGESAQLVAMFPEGWGPGGKNEGNVWLTLEGTTLFSSKMLKVSGLTSIQTFPIERRFGSAVYASLAYPTSTGRWEERVVPIRVIPSERTLRVSVKAEKSETAPLGKQTVEINVRDFKGRGVVSQVSLGIVDKAIYALQAEFRPSVLDFFYPLVRNDVTSFYSAEFQGYGYGEVLAMARGRIHGVEFAAIKPPTKKQQNQEKDTAYWNPSIVTDADGHASITFDLPSNQTLWTMTVVAADASGRFGESTGEFATRGDVNLVSSLPQFLRSGDTATGSVRIAKGGKSGAKVEAVTLDLAAGGSIGDAKKSEAIASLEKTGEKVVPIALTAGAPGAGTLTISVKGAPSSINDRRAVPVVPAAMEETIVASADGGGTLTLDLPAGATVDTVDLSLGAGSVEIAMDNLRDLLEYPYGCLEQLNATTTPNVAVYSTLQKVGGIDGLDPDSKSLLAESRSRALNGLDKILKLEVKGGGFTLWPGQTKPEADLTLIALEGLSYAIDAGLVDANDPRIVESEAWVGRQDLPPTLDANRAYVLARLTGNAQQARVRALVAKVDSADFYAVATTVLAAESAGVAEEPAVKQRLGALIEQSNRGVVSLAAWKPDPNVFWHFPMHEVGMTALLAHAASFGKTDVAVIRKRLLHVMTDGKNEMSTLDRSTFLLHSLWLLEKDAKEMRAMSPPAISVGGTPAVFSPHGSGVMASLDRTVTKVEVPKFEGVATLRAKALVPYASVKPLQEGMAIDRSYYVLRGGKKVLLPSGGTVATGEEVFVELHLDAHGGDRFHSSRSAYYVVEDQIPAGFTALQEDKTWRGAPWTLPLTHGSLASRGFSPSKATFFFEEPAWWSDSPRVIGYVMRAQFAGTFSAPPASVQDMYASKVRARTAGSSITVKPSGG